MPEPKAELSDAALGQLPPLRVHAVEPRSRANGPGARFVVWFQGCTLGCVGCYNPATHPDNASATPFTIDALAAQLDAALASRQPPEGLSLTGGEPMQQSTAALALLREARGRGLSTLMFSGYTIEEIKGLPNGSAILAELDVLIDGRYDAKQRLAVGLRGSANQQIHLLTTRYRAEEVHAVPTGEVRITPSGDVIVSGVAPLILKQK